MPSKSLESFLQRRRRDADPTAMTTTAMAGVVTQGTGGYEQLHYSTHLARPHPPGPGEVLLQVLAAGMNNTDINTRLGWYSSAVEGGTTDTSSATMTMTTDATTQEAGGWNGATPFPMIQGTDCCGRVVEYGEGVIATPGDEQKLPKIGQRCLVRPCMRVTVDDFSDPRAVWVGVDFDGAFCQYVVVPAHEVFAVSDTNPLTDEELAAVPCAYGTAENMLHRVNVKAGDRVLVTGASGGVGTAAVQLAQRRGAYVIAVVGKSKMKVFDEQLKPNSILERSEDLVESLGEQSVDVVVDTVAGPGFGALFKLLVFGGRYVTAGAIAGPIVTMDLRDVYLKDIRIQGSTAWEEQVFPNLISYLDRGDFRPTVAKVFALQDICKAQQQFMNKSHIGKFVLIPPQTT